jgi:hypothetical protein
VHPSSRSAEANTHGRKSWAAVATIVQAVFLPISLFLVWFQLKQQSRLTKRLIDEPTYSSWNEDLKNFVSRMNLAEHWPSLRSSFQKGFAEHVGKLVDSSRRVEH